MKHDKRSELRKEYDNSVRALRTFIPGSDDYKTQLLTVERLHRLLMDEESQKNRVSLDTVVTAALGLAQVGMIIGYERFHHIGSKAINFVMKGRLR